MKKALVLCLLGVSLLTGCARSSQEVWEDTKTCGRYMGKGFRYLFGRGYESQEVAYEDQWNEFIPLSDTDQYENVTAQVISKESPGDPGSPIPGIDGFSDPSSALAKIFAKIHFDTDTYTIKGRDNLEHLQRIANYLTAHPATYVFVEGHADERGTAAYNLALGSRRANAVRSHLIEHGVHPDQLFTISYGKERPSLQSHNETAWKENRRSQFKLYTR